MNRTITFFLVAFFPLLASAQSNIIQGVDTAATPAKHTITVYPMSGGAGIAYEAGLACTPRAASTTGASSPTTGVIGETYPAGILACGYKNTADSKGAPAAVQDIDTRAGATEVEFAQVILQKTPGTVAGSVGAPVSAITGETAPTGSVMEGVLACTTDPVAVTQGKIVRARGTLRGEIVTAAPVPDGTAIPITVPVGGSSGVTTAGILYRISVVGGTAFCKWTTGAGVGAVTDGAYPEGLVEYQRAPSDKFACITAAGVATVTLVPADFDF